MKKNAATRNDLSDENFRKIFETVPGLYLILTPDFTIIAASDAYLQATNTKRATIMGKPLFEVFPDNPNDPQATGVKNLTKSLNNVLSKKVPDAMAVQKYDIRLPENKTKFEVRYWSPLNTPVLNEKKDVDYIIHSAVDVTEFIRAEQSRKEQIEISEQLKEQNKFFHAQMTQNAKALEEHLKIEQEMQEIDMLKSDFVKIASHQLRTPLTSIKWSSEELLSHERKLSEQEKENYVEQIHSSNERMIALIHELLDLSEIDVGKFKTTSELLWLPPILDQVLADMAIQIEQKMITINKDVEPDLPAMHCDPVWLRLILQNVLNNAIKYSSPGQVVNISVAGQGKDIIVTVADNGCGIPFEQKDQVFNKFFRADNARKLSSDGTGVGLYIAKKITEDAGGKIWFESTENKGTTFYIKLPIKTKVVH